MNPLTRIRRTLRWCKAVHAELRAGWRVARWQSDAERADPGAFRFGWGWEEDDELARVREDLEVLADCLEPERGEEAA